MIHYSAILALIQKWGKEATHLEIKAGQGSGMERTKILTTAEVLRGCQCDLSAVLFDMLDLAVEEDQQAFLPLQRERGQKGSPDPDADEK
jgi:hypothetical protein